MSDSEHRGLGRQLMGMLAQGAGQLVEAGLRNTVLPPLSPEAEQEERQLLARLRSVADGEKCVLIRRLAEFGQVRTIAELLPLAMTGTPEVRRAAQTAMEQIQLRLTAHPPPVPPPPASAGTGGRRPAPPPPPRQGPAPAAVPPPSRVTRRPPEQPPSRSRAPRRQDQAPPTPATDPAPSGRASLKTPGPLSWELEARPSTPAGVPELPEAAALPEVGALPEGMPELPVAAPLPAAMVMPMSSQ